MKWKLITYVALVLCILMPLATVMAADTNISGNVTVLIFDTSTSNIGYYLANISWNTNSPADSQVEYGTTVSYGLTTPLSTDLVTSHVVQLTGLSSGTTYHFRVKSGNTSGTTISDDYTFTTNTVPSGGGGTTTPSYSVQTDLFGGKKDSPISPTGEVLSDIEGTSTDGNLTITIFEGTMAKESDGTRLKSLDINAYQNPPAPPADNRIIGLAYNFEPNGATFDPPMTITWKYDPATLGDTSEESLVLAYYDEVTYKWVEVEGKVDTVNNTITAKIKHFTLFAVIGELLPVTLPTTSITPITTTSTVTTTHTTIATSIATTTVASTAVSTTGITSTTVVTTLTTSTTLATISVPPVTSTIWLTSTGSTTSTAWITSTAYSTPSTTTATTIYRITWPIWVILGFEALMLILLIYCFLKFRKNNQI